MLHTHSTRGFRARRRGVSLLLFVLSLPVIVGVTGLVVDLAHLQTLRAVAQRASDAAALAGAMVATTDSTSGTGSNDAAVIAEATRYANLNGYFADKRATITVDPHVGGQLGKVQVTLTRPEQVFFVPMLEVLLGSNPTYSRNVAATATAQKFVTTPLDLGGDYGTTTGASNPAAFGPYSLHSFGDPYSVKYHNNGKPNDADNLRENIGVGWNETSRYNPDGFTYSMSVSSQFAANNSVVRVQLYDPDGHDSDLDSDSLDEFRLEHPPGHPPTKPQTRTKYTIYKVRSDGSLQEITSAEYWDDPATDAAVLKSQGLDPWITPEGFKVPLSQYGAGEYKIRVQTLDGSSENGYNLRAGPDYEGTKSETEWNVQYGDRNGTRPELTQVPIKADDKLQMNFTRTSRVKVRLGYIPRDVAGKELTVTKFDTDIGATNISYSYIEDGSQAPKPAAGESYLNPSDDTWSQNKVAVPADFQGGYWYAEYDAGQDDTSSWSITYPGVGNGSVRLVR